MPPDLPTSLYATTPPPISTAAAVRLVVAFFDARHEGNTDAALDLIADDAEWLFPSPFAPAVGKQEIAQKSILQTPIVEPPQPAAIIVPFSVDATLSTPHTVVVYREVRMKMGDVKYRTRNELHVEMRPDQRIDATGAQRLMITKHELTGTRDAELSPTRRPPADNIEAPLVI